MAKTYDPDKDHKRPEFDGETYESDLDHGRLATQLAAVRLLMSDGEWRTLDDISLIVSGTIQSISARLRDLRKEKFGKHIVDRRRAAGNGLFEYRLIVNE